MLFVQQPDTDFQSKQILAQIMCDSEKTCSNSWAHLKGFNLPTAQTLFQEKCSPFVTFSAGKPILSATAVIQVSVTSADWGKPNPLNAVFDGKFVLQA